MPPILDYRGVCKAFSGGGPVLDGFTLSVAPGETVVLVGPSGSGKTTALKLANRLLEADSGEVRVFERPVGEQDPIARKAAQNEFRSWKKRLTSAVLLVTHDLREAFALGDRIAVVHEGRIRQAGSREDLTTRPADAFVREFVSELAS